MAATVGKYLSLDLAGGSQEIFTLPQALHDSFLGGSGLAARLFLEDVGGTSSDLDPFSPANPLYVFAGPLAGTNLPGSSRFAVVAKSPLTGLLGEGTCGGYFGPELKFAGYEGLVLRSASERPVYLDIEDGRAELRDAADLWGRDIYETTRILRDRHPGSRKLQVLAIGPAGERRVRFATISNNGAHFIGRTGMGAVMGSKNLKAIVARGSHAAPVALPDEQRELRKMLLAKIKSSMVAQSLGMMGTNASMDMGHLTGNVPVANWSEGRWEGTAKVGGMALSGGYFVRRFTCHACPIGCKRVVEVKDGAYRTEEGPGPEYETCAALGTLLKNDDLAAILKMNETCGRLGLDTISCGGVIALATHCAESGILAAGEAGEKLAWGNADAAIGMIGRIARREGFGDVLADGSRLAARAIGRGAADLAVEVKGLEAPMHDPRAFHGMGLAYAVGSRGACHLQHLNTFIEQGVASFPGAGFEESYKPRRSEGKARMTVLSENLGIPCGSSLLCLFVQASTGACDHAEMIRTTTGRDFTLDDLMRTGERIWLLKRGINNLMGARRADDRLPKALVTPLPEHKGRAPDIEGMLAEYYPLRGLDANGVPTREKLEEVGGLRELVSRLHG